MKLYLRMMAAKLKENIGFNNGQFFYFPNWFPLLTIVGGLWISRLLTILVLHVYCFKLDFKTSFMRYSYAFQKSGKLITNIMPVIYAFKVNIHQCFFAYFHGRFNIVAKGSNG